MSPYSCQRSAKSFIISGSISSSSESSSYSSSQPSPSSPSYSSTSCCSTSCTAPLSLYSLLTSCYTFQLSQRVAETSSSSICSSEGRVQRQERVAKESWARSCLGVTELRRRGLAVSCQKRDWIYNSILKLQYNSVLKCLFLLQMNKIIGIRKEDKSCWERRTPLTPTYVAHLLNIIPSLRILVQSSKIRIYSDHQYEKAGAEIVTNLDQCSLILGIKEVPVDKFISNKTYMFFSHTHKGQPYNMKALKTILDKNIRLIDYELISDAKGRLIAFGEYAGIAGAIDFLTGLGWTLINRRVSNQFLLITNSYTYDNLEQAYNRITFAGQKLAAKKIDESLLPMVFVVTGTGRTAVGVLKVIERLPHKKVSVADLPHLPKDPSTIFICQVDSCDVMEDGEGKYDKKDYKQHPEKYHCTFQQKVLPFTSCLYQCIYWEAAFPRYVTKKGLRELALKQQPLKLLGVCDVSCDLEGSLQMTTKFTTPDDPYFMYDPIEMKQIPRLAEVLNKVLYMTLDFLPCQLASDASNHFSNKLKDLVPMILESNAESVQEQKMNLPKELSRAVIAAKGQLTPNFKHLATEIEKHGH